MCKERLRREKARDRDEGRHVEGTPKGFDEKVTSIKIRVEFECTGFGFSFSFFVVFVHARLVFKFFSHKRRQPRWKLAENLEKMSKCHVDLSKKISVTRNHHTILSVSSRIIYKKKIQKPSHNRYPNVSTRQKEDSSDAKLSRYKIQLAYVSVPGKKCPLRRSNRPIWDAAEE